MTIPNVAYRTAKIDGLDIFYREAGPKDAPAILLLHGFPTSSQMFRNLIPALADEIHLVAPDYPGFGHSSAPPVDQFNYTFDNLADVVDKFIEQVGLKQYALYVQDYGAPVGYRLAVRHPERVTALVVQNGNAYEEGLDNDFWKPFKAYWQDRSAKNADALRRFLTLEATRWQYTHGVRNVEVISPDTWTIDQAERLGYDARPGEEIFVIHHPRFGTIDLGHLLRELPLGRQTFTVRLIYAPELEGRLPLSKGASRK